jgi:hypothetical protein
MLFPYGERGFQIGVLHSGTPPVGRSSRCHMTMQEYYCYHFHYRRTQPNPFLCYGLLPSLAKVDAHASIDESRLQYIIQNQKNLRMESVQEISDAVTRGCTDGDEIGRRVILPASHVGGRRYMFQNYHDGLAICRVYGPSDFFVTFTCNPNWPEITASLFELGQASSDRSDVIVRVYHLKLNELLHDIRSGIIFGPCIAGMPLSWAIFFVCVCVTPILHIYLPKLYLNFFIKNSFTLLNSRSEVYPMLTLFFGFPLILLSQRLS